jgi:hypothetical protein
MHAYTMAITVMALFFTGSAASLPEIAEWQDHRFAQNVRERPLTISAAGEGKFDRKAEWYLSVNSAGQAELTLHGPDGIQRRQFEVPPQAMAGLQEALIAERFHRLSPKDGSPTIDAGFMSLSVTAGGETMAIRLNVLPHQSPNAPQERARAARIMLLVHRWIDAAEASDFKPYLEHVIHASGPR